MHWYMRIYKYVYVDKWLNMYMRIYKDVNKILRHLNVESRSFCKYPKKESIKSYKLSNRHRDF